MIAFNLILSLLAVGALAVVAGVGYAAGTARREQRAAIVKLSRRRGHERELEAA